MKGLKDLTFQSEPRKDANKIICKSPILHSSVEVGNVWFFCMFTCEAFSGASCFSCTLPHLIDTQLIFSIIYYEIG